MTDVLRRVFVEFLVAREQAVQRPTYGRDLLVVAELQAALDAVINVGGGLARIDDRRDPAKRMPWEGPFTTFDQQLLTAATQDLLARIRADDLRECDVTVTDVERTLRQLGRWLCQWKQGGIDAMGMGFKLVQNPSNITWASRGTDPTAPQRGGRRRLRLVVSD